MEGNLEEVKKLQKKSREPEEIGGRGVWDSEGVVLWEEEEGFLLNFAIKRIDGEECYGFLLFLALSLALLRSPAAGLHSPALTSQNLQEHILWCSSKFSLS